METYALFTGVLIAGLCLAGNVRGAGQLVGSQGGFQFFKLRVHPGPVRQILIGRVIGAFLSLTAALAMASEALLSTTTSSLRVGIAMCAGILGFAASLAVWWVSRAG